MPELTHTLQGHDLGFLKMVAQAWGIELEAPDAAVALPVLATAIHSRPLVAEVVETLPPEAREALQAVLENEGRLPWALFTRRFGDVRAMGAARRDRERPDLKPISAAEVLWYHALIGKAFFNLPPEPQEYAYIPEDLIEYLEPLGSSSTSPIGRPASPAESARPMPASDAILDHACTLLAALRMGLDPAALHTAAWPLPVTHLRDLLYTARLLDAHHMPLPEPTKAFLEAPRGQALNQLFQAWLRSTAYNDLRHLPGLRFEGEWFNDPLQARHAVLALLSHLPQETWWNLNSFVAGVKQRKPDFQRPAGDYDSWYIRPEGSETYLRGFSCWDEVDGALIRYLITGPLHWLGVLDLAGPEDSTNAVAFRPSAWAAGLYNDLPPKTKDERAALRVFSDGRLQAPAGFPRSARYLLARFCEWETENDGGHQYRLSPTSLQRADKQGLRVTHLISLLRKGATSPLPPDLLQALERWEKFGQQAQLERPTLLRVASPDILSALRKTRAARYLGEALNDTTIVVRPGGELHVRNALAEIGYLTDWRLEV